MSGVNITRDELVRHAACSKGIALFDAIAPSGTLHIPEWTAMHALWIAVAEPSHCGWLVERGIIPRACLTRADLTGADLRGADLKEDGDESFTWTFYRFGTAKGYVTVRWYGTSNGYYSESVSFRETTKGSE